MHFASEKRIRYYQNRRVQLRTSNKRTQTVGISSGNFTFNVQLLRSYVTKAPNDTADLTVFFVHSGSMCIKAVRRTLMKLSPGDKTIIVYTYFNVLH